MTVSESQKPAEESCRDRRLHDCHVLRCSVCAAIGQFGSQNENVSPNLELWMARYTLRQTAWRRQALASVPVVTDCKTRKPDVRGSKHAHIALWRGTRALTEVEVLCCPCR